MVGQSTNSAQQWAAEAPCAITGGARAEHSPDLHQATVLHGAADPHDATVRAPDAEAWWQYLGIGLMAVLLIVGAATVPPSGLALAETTLGDPIPVGSQSFALAANPVTNRIYVASGASDSVTVIDGTTNAIIGSPITVGKSPQGIAVNPVTNRVFVANTNSNTVSVLDGDTGAAIRTPILTGKGPFGIAVNPSTNRIYVVNRGFKTVSVIDGSTNSVTGSIPVGTDPVAVAVNPTTNRIYVTDFNDGTLTVIDGANNTVIGSPIRVASNEARAVAVNPLTNRIYVAATQDSTVKVLDGATNALIGAPIVTDGLPEGVAVDSATDRIYATVVGPETVVVIDGATNAAVGSQIPAGASPIGIDVNPVTGQVYVANDLNISGSVRVVGVPFASGASNAQPGGAITATWDHLFAPSNADFVGLFAPGAPNTSPLSRRLTNGLAAPGGPALGEGAVDLVIPADLAAGSYEMRLVSGPSGGTLARTRAVTPVVANDSFSVGAGSILNVPAPGVLANDTDAGSPSLQAVVVTNPSHGVLSLQLNGALSYTPNAGFSGTDTFTYHAIGQSGLPATATATIAVSIAPTANDDTFTVVAGNVLRVAAPGVLANDADPDSPSLQATVVNTSAHGTLALQANGAFTYTPGATFSGTDTFTYRARDDASQSAPATVTIAVTAVPIPPAVPTAGNDTFTVVAGNVLTVSAPGVLANDTVADSPTLQSTVVSNPAHGTLSLQPNGALSYTPNATFSGPDSFTYRATSQAGQSATATVTITVAAVPVAANDAFAAVAGSALNVEAPGVLANDTDADSPSLQAVLATNPTHGTLALQPSGAFTYTPTASFVGADSFTYRSTDQTSQSAPATVTITVAGLPAASSDTFTVVAGNVLNVPAPGVLANDTSPDSPTLQATVVTNPAHGSLTLQPNGSFTYTPNPDFAGTDTFTYRAGDERVQSAPASATIAVTPTACVPRPRVQATPAVGGGKLLAHIESTPFSTQQPNALRAVRFGTFQNARVTLNGQPIASGQVFTVPAGSSAIDFTIERVTPGQPTTVPLTLVDGCGEWPTFVGGGTGAGF